MQEREQRLVAHHQDDKGWRTSITNMIAKTKKWVAPGQEAREKVRDKMARMDGGGIVALHNADTTREGIPEKCKLL
jgi:hypothetical protein